MARRVTAGDEMSSSLVVEQRFSYGDNPDENTANCSFALRTLDHGGSIASRYGARARWCRSFFRHRYICPARDNARGAGPNIYPSDGENEAS